MKQAKIIRALAPAVEGPGKRRNRAFRETLKARRHLQDAERVRSIIVSLPDDIWAKNFATSKEEMLYSVETRIGRLRKGLGLLQ